MVFFRFFSIFYEPYLCNGCHIMQKAMSFKNLAIFSVKGSDYRIHFWYMSKDDAINIMKNSDLNKENGSLNFFCLI